MSDNRCVILFFLLPGHRRHHHHHHHRHHHPRGSHTEVDTGGGLVSSKTSGTGSTAYLMEEMDGGELGHHHQLSHHHTLTMSKEKEVSFANCTNGLTSSSSPPTPSRAGYLVKPIQIFLFLSCIVYNGKGTVLNLRTPHPITGMHWDSRVSIYKLKAI